METLCTIMCLITIISCLISILLYIYSWSTFKICEHLGEKRTKSDEVILVICIISLLIALISSCIIIFTPLHTYGLYQ